MSSQPTDERSAETLAGRQAWIAFAVIVGVSFVVNATSEVEEWTRAGNTQPAIEAWLFEGTSAVIHLGLFALVLRLERRFPVDGPISPRLFGTHLAGSFVYSALHVAGMFSLREIIWRIFFNTRYHTLPGMLSEFPYEYRKDIATYGLILFVIYLFRTREFARLEAATAKAEASRTERLSVKCGGRTIFIDPARVLCAKAAGNYVEITTANETYLARTSLTDLEKQLIETGADAIRVHRSWLVARSSVAEVIPTGEGDVRLKLSNGDEVPGSRRYRHRLEEPQAA